MLTSALLELPEAPDGAFAPLELAFGQLIRDLAPGAPPEVLLAAMRVCQAMRQGHSCLDLRAEAGREGAPSAAAWRASLQASPVVGAPGAVQPLILDGARLYLYRYWQYEQQVAQRLRQLAQQTFPLDLNLVRAAVAELLPSVVMNLEQRIAAVLPLFGGVTLITGGPGTGKTTTVLRLLALLIRLDPALKIVLAAPTGKAVTRLYEALSAQQQQLPPELATHLPLNHCLTVHRLLGMPRHGTTPRHHARLPLPWDVVVVDEASMLDLALMAKLCNALAPDARLVLLGDPDQLASVEAGNVLGDLTGHGVHHDCARVKQLETVLDASIPAPTMLPSGLSASSVHLRHSFRFDPARGIGALAAALRKGDSTAVLALLAESAWPELRWFNPEQHTWQDWLSLLRTAYAPVQASGSVVEAHGAYQRFRVLCAHRQGERGAEGLNFALEQRLHPREARTRWPQGKPLLITANDYARGVFNGDIGLCWPDDDHRMRVYFPVAGQTFRALLPARLAAYEPAYALTVHKSQGSEFDTVALVLPDAPSPVLTRELLYTALTRARSGFWLWGKAGVIAATVEHRLRRYSGLAGRLAP